MINHEDAYRVDFLGIIVTNPAFGDLLVRKNRCHWRASSASELWGALSSKFISERGILKL
jgi:hypothetical protein